MPTDLVTKGKTKKRQLDYMRLPLVLTPPGFETPTTAVVELVNAMPGQGVTSMFNFGQVTGAVLGALGQAQIPTERITPRQWQAELKVSKDGAAARHMASSLYPNFANMLIRKKDDGRADAILIATAQARIINRRTNS